LVLSGQIGLSKSALKRCRDLWRKEQRENADG
jgi:hypothetical protein